MEGNRNQVTDKICDIPYMCLTKCAIFVMVATFVLYLPLGDPHSPHSLDRRTGYGSVCCLCDIYILLTRMYIKTMEIINYVIDVFKEALYDVKLQVYGVLKRIDKKDLCRSACSEEWEEDVNVLEMGDNKRRTRPVCRCVKKKCCRSKQ